jgi:hypothetical protein
MGFEVVIFFPMVLSVNFSQCGVVLPVGVPMLTRSVAVSKSLRSAGQYATIVKMVLAAMAQASVSGVQHKERAG